MSYLFPSFSDLLGYACICCWLGAQFPQILENARRRSCEGLAFPLLANWFLGDLSNLIGCILTHQLPFQTWLATYFVSIDLVLVGQFIYYLRIQPPLPVPKPRFPRKAFAAGTTPRYRALSAVAANVATVAALAAQQDEQADFTRHSARWYRASHDQLYSGGFSQDQNAADEEEAFAAMAESFHSEGPRNLGRHSVSWSRERYDRRGGSIGRYPNTARSALGPHFRMTSGIADPLGSMSRGRSLIRDDEGSGQPQRPNSRVSRLASTTVFLGVVTLFGLGAVPDSRRNSSIVTGVGTVLTARSIPQTDNFALRTSQLGNFPTFFLHGSSPAMSEQEPHTPGHLDERILGRIFAWLCTTLYLTSRMPQIWKNFARKSVEGLSMYLFFFAFLGNSFYVASIVTNPNFYAPPPISTEFIKESVPFLLGSGGTLIFDVIILMQSFVYRPKRRHRRSRSRFAEETGLLSEDLVPNNSTDSVVQSRGRLSSVNRTTS